MLLLGLAAGFFFLHPFWYGDATWYARHIAASAVPLDAGHLAWQPLGFAAWSLLRRVGVSLDPLVVLRVLSALATALGCLVTYRLAFHLGGGARDGLVAAALVGVSNFGLAYGGSGCSYTAAMAMSALAFVPIVSTADREWGARRALAAALAFAASWLAWGTTVMVLPALGLAAALTSRGPWPRRIARAATLCALAGLAVAAICVLVYLGFADRAGGDGFLEWLRESSHGRDLDFSPINAARAVYGLNVSLVHLGDTAVAFKGLLLGDRGAGASFAPFALAVAGAVAAAVVVAWIRLLRKAAVTGAPRARLLPAIALAVVLPIGFFAAGWKGTDIERFSQAVPWLSCVLAAGLGEAGRSWSRPSDWSTRLAWVVVGMIAIVNLGGWVIPMQLSRGGTTMAIGRVARQHLPPGSLMIVAGHSLVGDAANAADYFFDIGVDNLTFDVMEKGVPGWRERLHSRIDRALARGGKIAVVSDLLGQPTSGGIGFVEREHPEVVMKDLIDGFAGWRRGPSWKVGRFTFVEVTPP